MKKRILALLLAGAMLLGMTACNGGGSVGSSGAEDSGTSDGASTGDTGDEGDASAEDLPWLEYDIIIGYSTSATTLDNPNDVVSPYVEEKFHIRVGEVAQVATSDIPFRQMLATRIAAGNEPDVFLGGSENVAYALSTGKYGDNLEEQIAQMDNLNKYMDQSMWPRFTTDGQRKQIPLVMVNTSNEEFASDPYNQPFTSWALWTREDLLAACGYSFTPLAEIDEEYCQKGEVPPEEVFAIEPAIDTPEKLADYLQQIADLGIKVGDRDLIPMSLISWSQFHVGTMFETGHWAIEESGEINGFLGGSGTKEYYQWLNDLYNRGLLDADFISQMDDQLQQKVASGLVGVGMMVPNMATARESLLASNPEAMIRYIPWPKQEGTSGGSFDIYESGFNRVTVSNSFEGIDRLCEMWDWMYSDEGLDILTWGPEGTGIWEYADDGTTKVFVDPETEEDCLDGIIGEKGADYYGLYEWTGGYFPFMSEIAICSPAMSNYNPMSYLRSYPAEPDIYKVNQSYCYTGGYNFDGTASYGDGTDDVAVVNNYYWADWAETDCAKVVTCSPEEFDAVFDEAQQNFYKETDYENAQARMETWFEENTGWTPQG